MDSFIERVNRREFIYLLLASLFGFSDGCTNRYIKGDLKKVGKGFRAYNEKNPYLRHIQTQTFLDNIQEHKAAWAGAQYRLPHDMEIVASARGKVSTVRTKKGYHGFEDDVKIDHGGGVYTRYFHMKPNSSDLSWGKEVERGQVVGKADRKQLFKTSMSYMGILGDMDDYGLKMGYMRYWDGVMLDYDNDVVVKKSELHVKLINELRKRYLGPGAELMQTTNFNGIPASLSHDRAGQFNWSYAMLFKFLKYIYKDQPNFFSGADNFSLVNDIITNQPITLTIPFNTK